MALQLRYQDLTAAEPESSEPSATAPETAPVVETVPEEPAHEGPSTQDESAQLRQGPLSPDEIAELDMAGVQARIEENEQESSMLVMSDEHYDELAAEHYALQLRYQELTAAEPRFLRIFRRCDGCGGDDPRSLGAGRCERPRRERPAAAGE